jgi:hypothetical protein
MSRLISGAPFGRGSIVSYGVFRVLTLWKATGVRLQEYFAGNYSVWPCLDESLLNSYFCS